MSANKIAEGENDRIYVPHLEQLVLSSLSLKSAKMLRVFRSYQLKYLDMRVNKISTIDDQDVVLFCNLTYLDLTSNQLSSINNLIYYLSKLEELYLNINQISVVPKSFISRTNLPFLHSFNLLDNPLVCDCSVEPLGKWLVTDTVVLLKYYFKDDNNFCCASPDHLKGLSITEIDLDCEPQILLYVSISIVCVVIMTLIVFLVVWYRWHIQYRLFLLFHRRRNFQNNLAADDDGNEDEDGVPRYGAYVTYHRGDEDWVADQLEVNIEGREEPFRLCIKNRDIRAGRLIFSAISQCIQRSRKVLVILSPRFVEDNWCYFELNMAHHRVHSHFPHQWTMHSLL